MKKAFLLLLMICCVSLTKPPVISASSQFDTINKLEKSEATAGSAPEQMAITKPDISYKSGSLKDPFRSPIKREKVVSPSEAPVADITSSPPPPLVIQGIIWGGVINQAIINNKVLKTGDTIDDARIVDINQDAISVFFKNRLYKFPSPAALSKTHKEQSPKGGKK